MQTFLRFFERHLTEQVDYVAVLVAAVAAFLIGALWYSPLLFSKPWFRRVYGEVPVETLKANMRMSMPVMMLLSFLLTFIMALGLGMVLFIYPINWVVGALFGLFISTFFIAANTYKHYLYENRPFSLLLISAGHDIVCFVVMGAILGGWEASTVSYPVKF